jgi:hypothetical protein
LKLYDLETFASNKKSGSAGLDAGKLLDNITFKVVLDDNIIPPLDVLEEKVDREIILTRQRVIVQKRLEHAIIFDQIEQNVVENPDTSPVLASAEDQVRIEYEDAGVLPDGAFMFREHVAVLHVDKRGLVQQIDLMKQRSTSRNAGKPINSEFKNMLVQDVTDHEWSDLVSIFLKDT